MPKSFRLPLWCLALVSTVLLPARRSFGWIDAGHKVVALVAWEDLTPKTRAAVSTLLKAHPQFERDLLRDAPKDAGGEALDRHVFANAAVWPDFVKSPANPMHAIYSHPAWHYIDIPLVEDGAKAPDMDTSKEPHDVVTALLACTAELKDVSTPDKQKAVDLCWITHLIGDIEQPLHCASLYSAAYPNGDVGGNSEYILRDPPYPDSEENLHLLWDSLPGDFADEDIDRYEALGLHDDPQYSRAALKNLLEETDFMKWAEESHALAVKDAYLDGKLESAPKTGHFEPHGKIPGVPPGYVDHAEHVAMHQVALGGYRLADVLNGIFDPR